MTLFDISGVSSTSKRPMFFAKLFMAVGAVSAASLPTLCLCVGQKISAGTITADAAPVEAFSDEECDTYGGVGSEIARMGRTALAKGCRVFLGAVTAPAGDAPTVTSVISGTWSTAGELNFKIGEITINVPIAAGDAIDDVGAAIVSKFGLYTQLPVTAAYSAGSDTLTLTHKNVGARFKDTIVQLDVRLAPSGYAQTLVGSATLTSTPVKRVRMGASSTGTGTDDVTTFLATLAGTRYARQAWAQADATNAALIEAYIDDKGGPTKLIFEQAVFGHNGSSSAAISIAQTTLNHYFSQVCAMRNSDTFPSEIAAEVAGLRAAAEGDQPVGDYDGLALTKVQPHGVNSDKWTNTEEETLLNSGVTPINTVNSKACITRAIVTYCLNAQSVQDDRCLDVGDASFAQYAVMDLQSFYWSDFRVANPYVGPNPAAGEPEAPSGVATPGDWAKAVDARKLDWYQSLWIEFPTAAEATLADYNSTARRIQSQFSFVVRRVQHQLGVIGRQQSPAL